MSKFLMKKIKTCQIDVENVQKEIDFLANLTEQLEQEHQMLLNTTNNYKNDIEVLIEEKNVLTMQCSNQSLADSFY